MFCKAICNTLVIVFLVSLCVVLFVLQSLYFISKITENTEKEQIKTTDGSPLSLPAIIICNRMPFSQDGTDSVNRDLRQDPAIRFLLEWTRPSLRYEPDYVRLSHNYLNAGQTILLQYLPQSNRNQSINQMEYMCQSVINSCSYKERNIQAYECCKNVIHKVATTNGLCWVFYDRYMSQDSSQPMQQFSLTLQMSRNSWYSQQTTPIHPGIDIYLKENVNDVMTIVNQLENPIRLLDKKGIHMKIHKEKRVDLRRKLCGSSLSEAELVDKNALARNATNILMCVIMISMHYCGCHPLLAEMIPYETARFSKIFLRDFSLRVNSTQVCTLDQYETCARPYVHMARPSSWLEPVPKDMLGAADISYCRRQNPYPCQTVSYPGIIDHYDLPSVYQNTQDFVARLVLQYTTTQVTEVLKTNGSNVYDLLSHIGYNIATWFTIGHIIWNLYTLVRDTLCSSQKIAAELR
ncbi:hypothetical protein Angca_002054, partial [Angiostrongylus cantonensis]